MKSRVSLLLVSLCLLVSCATVDGYKLVSPSGNLSLSLSASGGSLSYELFSGEIQVIESSEISIFKGAKVSGVRISEKSVRNSWKPAWGQFSEIEDNYNELSVNFEIEKADGQPNREVQLIARLFDEGVGFRYVVEDYSCEEDAELFVQFNTMPGDEFYWTAGEREPIGPITRETMADAPSEIISPLVVESQSGLHLSFIESDILMSPGFEAMDYFADSVSGAVYSLNSVQGFEGERLVSPWRVILVGSTAGDLVLSTVALNLATPCVVEDVEWVKPGKTMWDWRVHGYTAKDGFQYGIDTESYKRFVDFAAKKGIEYFMIDASWYLRAEKGSFDVSPKVNVREVVDYAAARGVDIILYYDRHNGEFGDEELFKCFSEEFGVKGIKYGFMGDDVIFSRGAIAGSAERKLIIDFHDKPLPAYGAERTYPNAISREYCHAQLDGRRTFTPESFIKTALVNAIQGPLDMNNGNYDIVSIDNGKRLKGPLEKHTYLSTVAAETARTLIVYSGLVCLPDSPESYAQKADLFEFIEKLPVGRWDESRILNSKMGRYITTARRCGKEWFVGSVMDRNGGELEINLDFLSQGVEYMATLYMDGEDADCKTNPESYAVSQMTVKCGDKIVAKIAKGGGHSMWIRPVE